jgi:4-amino-4-deoxy-L-arabinose transferase-like glycosyltransferase
VLAGIMAAAAALRLYRLDAESLWLDETFSVAVARGSWSYLFEQIVGDFHPPLYFVLLKLWFAVTDESGWAARLLSVVWSVGVVAATYAAGRTFVDRGTGILAAAIVAVAAFQVEYAQEARMYSLLALLATVSTIAFGRLDEPRRNEESGRRPPIVTGWWWAYVAASTALAYTHAVGAFVILAHALAAIIEWWRLPNYRRTMERWLMATAVVGLAFVPWLSVFALQFSTVQRGFWIEAPAIGDLPHTIEVFAGSLALAVVLVPLVVIGAVAPRRADAEETMSAARGTLVCWLIVPIVAPFLASLVGAPIFLPKYTIAASVPFALLAAAGMRRLPGPATVLTAAVVLGLSIQSLAGFHGTLRKDDWRGAIGDIEANAAPGALVLQYPYYVEYPWMVYGTRRDLRAVAFPKHASETTPPTLDAMLGGLTKGAPETWLIVIGYDPRRDEIVGDLGARYGALERRRRGHVDVYRATGPKPAAALRRDAILAPVSEGARVWPASWATRALEFPERTRERIPRRGCLSRPDSRLRDRLAGRRVAVEARAPLRSQTRLL